MKNNKNPWERFRFEFTLYINEQTKKDENANYQTCQKSKSSKTYQFNIVWTSGVLT